MTEHKYTEYIIPSDFLQYTNSCANFTYRKCNKCGMQWLSGLEEIISGYHKITNNYYFIDNKKVRVEEFLGLTCEEIVIKLAVE